MARNRVEGTSGADTLEVGGGNNDVFGFGGKDRIELTSSGDTGGGNTVDAGSGSDGVINQKEDGNTIKLGSGNDVYAGLGFALSGEGFDNVHGNTGDDTFIVATFHSEYFGDDGDDTFFAVGWQNDFVGGDGIDTISYEGHTDDATVGDNLLFIRLDEERVFTGNNRIETVVGIENATGSNNDDAITGSDVANVLEGLDGGDGLRGLGGNDVLRGGDGNDELEGNDGKDRVDGGDGNDLMDGGSGRDTLLGGAGGDTLSGGSSGDLLRGGTGKDRLTGGAGADLFDFNTQGEISNASLSKRDTITDFAVGHDSIDLSTIDANSTTPDTNNSFRFLAGEHDGFDGVKGRLIWHHAGGNTVVEGDVDGDGAADFQLLLTGLKTLAADDFAL